MIGTLAEGSTVMSTCSKVLNHICEFIMARALFRSLKPQDKREHVLDGSRKLVAKLGGEISPQLGLLVGGIGAPSAPAPVGPASKAGGSVKGSGFGSSAGSVAGSASVAGD